MVRSTQTVHQYCVKISTICEWTELSLEPYHLCVPSGASKMITKPMVRLAQIMHLSCTDAILSPNEKSENLHDPRHLGVLLGASKMISDPMVCST
jgi:hypothetical protein